MPISHEDIPQQHAESIDALLEDGERRLRDENPLVEHITDRATGLFNEAYTRMKLADEFKRTRRFHAPLTLILVSPDASERTAAEEERLLVEIAGVFLLESRDIDHLARISERELLMILPHTDGDGGLVMARRVLDAFEARGFDEEAGAGASASAGVICFEQAGAESPDALITRARESLATAQSENARSGLAMWSEAGPKLHR